MINESDVALNGRRLVRRIRADWRELIDEYGKARPFDLAIALALTWSKHAVSPDHFYPAALQYLRTGRATPLRKATACFGRFGPEPLGDALGSWRALTRSAKMLPAPDSLVNLIALRSRLFEIAAVMHQAGALRGVGAWLFCGPFKVLLCSDARWVRDPREREIPQPLGIEVMRGVRAARKWGWFPSVSSAMLEQEEGDLVEGMGTVYLIHGDSVPVGDRLGISVTELNTGLWWLGAPKA